MLRKHVRPLAAIGLATVLMVGVSACDGDDGSDGSDKESSSKSQNDPRCAQAVAGAQDLGDGLGAVNATPLPETPNLDKKFTPDEDYFSAKYDEDRYAVGWENSSGRVKVPKLENAYIATWQGSKGADCEIVELQGGKVQGGNPEWDLFTFAAGGNLPKEAKHGALVFDGPGEHGSQVVADLWNFEGPGSTIDPDQIELLQAFGDDLYK